MELRSERHRMDLCKVLRLMRDLGLKAKIRGRFKVTTESRHSIPVAANTFDRNFDVNKPNRVWTADIGYA